MQINSNFKSKIIILLIVLSLTTISLAKNNNEQENNLEEELNEIRLVEPDVEQVQQAALKFFRVHPDRVNAMRFGASWKAAVPWIELSGGAVKAGIDETTLLDEYKAIDVGATDPFATTGPWVKRNAQGQAFDIKARMSWNLPNLLFNPEELDVASLMMAQKDVISTITQLFYERRRLQVQMLANAPRDLSKKVLLQMRIEEITARLTGLTGGWYQKQLDVAWENKK